MMMNESMVNQKFVVEEINASEYEIHVLKTIGITKGSEIVVVGKGYFEGSLLVICNNVLLQMNPYFIKKISGSMVKEKSK